eukprot:13124968-Alexandrium_andersonii.AAC.1
MLSPRSPGGGLHRRSRTGPSPRAESHRRPGGGPLLPTRAPSGPRLFASMSRAPGAYAASGPA